MELRPLRYFLEILRHANFGRAAEALHITQPALSKSLRTLEEELGVKLLERGARGVVATPYGRILASYAGMATRELERAVEEIKAMAGRGGGIVRVGGSQSFIRYFVPSAMQRLLKQEPSVEIAVFEALRDDVIAALRRGDVDLAIVTHLDAAAAPDLVQEGLARDRICVVGSASHPLAGRARVGLAELAKYRWIVPNAREPERKLLWERMRAEGLPPPRIAVEGSSSILMAQLLRGHDQLSYLPRKLIEIDEAYAGLVPIECELDWPETEICLVYRTGGVILPAVRAFMAIVHAMAKEFERSKHDGPARKPSERARSVKIAAGRGGRKSSGVP